MSATYDIRIDWDNDGTFAASSGEDVTARVLARTGIMIRRGKDQVRALAPPAAGSIDFELDNISRDYSAENSSSPLNGNLLAGRAVRVQATVNPTTYNLAKGNIDDLPQHPERSKRSVGVRCLGSLAKLKGVKVSTLLYQNITTSTALGYLLDAAGWPAGDRVIATGKTTLEWWWLGDEDAFDAAVALLNTEGPGAALYEDGQGRIVFEDRHYRLLTARSTASQATISDTGSEPLHSAPFSYEPNRKNVINECQVTVNHREQDNAVSVVWEYGEPLTLAANEAKPIPVSGSDPFTGAIDPAGGTDYTVLSGSIASATLDRASGSYATLTITAGAGGAMIRGLQVRAYSVPVAWSRSAKNGIGTSASQAKYGLKSYSLSIRPEINYRVAEDFCDAVVLWYQEPAPTVKITLNSAKAERLTQILSREISDRVTVVESQTGLSADCWVEQIEHRIGEGGWHTTALGCSKVKTFSFWQWDVSKWNVGTWGW